MLHKSNFQASAAVDITHEFVSQRLARRDAYEKMRAAFRDLREQYPLMQPWFNSLEEYMDISYSYSAFIMGIDGPMFPDKMFQDDLF